MTKLFKTVIFKLLIILIRMIIIVLSLIISSVQKLFDYKWQMFVLDLVLSSRNV
jgi:hypothetical protein